jgi:hypothetical protein
MAASLVWLELVGYSPAVNRIRLQLSMTSVEPKDNGRLLIKGNAVLEIENSETPALVAETLTLVVP